MTPKDLISTITLDDLEQKLAELDPAKSPGADGLTRDDILADKARLLGAMHATLVAGTYTQRPIERLYMPKPDGGERPIACMSALDKIAQRAILEKLRPTLSAPFYSRSLGVSGGGTTTAQAQLLVDLVMRQPTFVLQLDIAQCFENIDQALLIDMLAPLVGGTDLDIVARTLNAEINEPDGTTRVRERGLEQGTPLAPLLANVYLHHALDVWLEGEEARELGLVAWVRYVDDVVLSLDSSEAVGVLEKVEERLQTFDLALKSEKCRRSTAFSAEAIDALSPGEANQEGALTFLGDRFVAAKLKTGAPTVQRLGREAA